MKRLKTFAVWMFLVAGALALIMMSQSGSAPPRAAIATFHEDLAAGQIVDVTLGDQRTIVRLSDGRRYSIEDPIAPNDFRQLAERGIRVRADAASGGWIKTLAFILVPLVILLLLVAYFVKKGQGNTANVLSLRKSRARLIGEQSKVTFDDVGGCAAAKEQLGDVIDFLRNPQHWISAGARIPRGVLLEGPPGSGKTLLARAVAGETKAKFYVVAASEFVEMFVGVGAARVRDMFETAAKQAPAVIFIDELDAVGRRRGSGVGSGHDEREQTLNQLLVGLDGFERNQQVVVMAATNRPDILDQALLRAGRFDRRIKIPEMTRAERLETLRIHTRDKRLAEDVALDELADQTNGFNGAQLEHLANEAAILAVRRSRAANGQPVNVSMGDFRSVLQSSRAKSSLFNKLDTVLIESTTQLAEPTGKAVVRITLDEAHVVVGEVAWVDANFIKVRAAGQRAEMIVPKRQVKTIEVLEGTEMADVDDLQIDGWSRPTGTM